MLWRAVAHVWAPSSAEGKGPNTSSLKRASSTEIGVTGLPPHNIRKDKGNILKFKLIASPEFSTWVEKETWVEKTAAQSYTILENLHSQIEALVPSRI